MSLVSAVIVFLPSCLCSAPARVGSDLPLENFRRAFLLTAMTGTAAANVSRQLFSRERRKTKPKEGCDVAPGASRSRRADGALDAPDQVLSAFDLAGSGRPAESAGCSVGRSADSVDPAPPDFAVRAGRV